MRLFLFFLALLLLSGQAFASSGASIGTSEPPVPAAPSPGAETRDDDILDEYMAEAERMLKACSEDLTMRQFKNCDCIASYYLDKRIADPEASSMSILDSLKGECIDGAEAAGQQYDTCINSAPPAGIDSHEKYCECVANTYVSLFKTYGGVMTSRAMVGIQTQTYLSCSRPDVAEKLYPGFAADIKTGQ